MYGFLLYPVMFREMYRCGRSWMSSREMEKSVYITAGTRMDTMKTEQMLLLSIANESITEGLKGDPPFLYHLIEKNPPQTLVENRGVFVTIKQGPSQELRGSVGSIVSDSPLYRSVYDMTKKAAFEDPRFRPLRERDRNDLTLSISILSSLKVVTDFGDIRLGIDGVLYRNKHREAMFLPEEPVIRQWSLDRLLSQLCLKMALPPMHYKSGEGTFYTFTTEDFEWSLNS